VSTVASWWGELRERARESLSDPVSWTERLQAVKTALAVVLSWVLAVRVLGLPQAYLAPWTALLVVHATVYRTLTTGLYQVGSAVIGVVLAYAVGNTLGLSFWSLGLLVLMSFVVGALPRVSFEATDVAAVAVLVMVIGYARHEEMLAVRFIDTLVGIVVGLAVNILLWPPMRDYTAARAIEGVVGRFADTLRRIAEDVRDGPNSQTVSGWIDQTRDLDGELDAMWGLLKLSRESGKLNPRRGARSVQQMTHFRELARRLEQAVAETRSMARTMGHSIVDVRTWDDRFRSTWLDLVDQAADALEQQDPQQLAGVRLGLDDLAHELSGEDLPAMYWPEYGALILNLRNIVTAVDLVADTSPTAHAVTGRPRLLRR
jgi:uncharacterized membrane protein YgaE (UPF0421/DUF939 family)